MDRVNEILKDRTFQHYDRIALAEAVIVRENSQSRPITYLEFHRLDMLRQWPFDSAVKLVKTFDSAVLGAVMIKLIGMLNQIARETKVPLSKRIEQATRSQPWLS